MTGEAFRLGGEPAPPSGPADTSLAAADRAARLQVLATEHWSLLATRSMTWNEAFSRSSIFLSVLSGATVALALVAQAMSFGSAFVTFALVILPIVLFIGLTTYFRLVEANAEDVIWVLGMNRIRNAYLTMVPDLAPYFVSGVHDDDAGIRQTFGMRGPTNAFAHAFITMPGTISVVDAAIAAVIAGLVGVQLHLELVGSLVLGGLTFVAVIAVLSALQQRTMIGAAYAGMVRFPTPPGGGAPTP